jgi:hypothetical protein
MGMGAFHPVLQKNFCFFNYEVSMVAIVSAVIESKSGKRYSAM